MVSADDTDRVTGSHGIEVTMDELLSYYHVNVDDIAEKAEKLLK